MLMHPLRDKLRELKLSGMLDTMEARVELAEAQRLSPVEFLALLLEDEIERRRQAKMVRSEKAAGFESPKRLSQFDFMLAPGLSRHLVMSMASCQFIRNAQNWLICGPTGVGKSHLATAIGYEAIRQGMRVVAGSTHQLVTDLVASRGDSSYGRRLNRLVSCDLLVFDDFGLRTLSMAAAEELYEIIRGRYERGSILLTTNRDPEELPAVFGDGLLASAALDRLTHHAEITVINMGSVRQRQRQERLTPAEASRDASGSTGDAST